MNADEYVQSRLESEIDWYSEKSRTNKRRHLTSRCLEIVCASIIPLLAGYAGEERIYLSWIIGGLGVVIAVSAAVTSLFKFQELWIKYRTTAESLKKEKYLYLTHGEPYNGPDPLSVLVQRVETLVSQENTNWAQYMMKPATVENRRP